ncbi:MAG: DUF6249 domain-containing protein [Proteobacteria bacterium]|nr:DUF6249 domain-containing protein [Pseudomonadota bacterium]
MSESMIPVALFLMIGSTFGLFFYFRHKTRQEVQTTIRVALERGQELSPELLDKLTSSLVSPHSDLRRGAVLTASGIGLSGFAAVDGDPEIFAVSGIVLLIGLTYVGLWYFLNHRKT